MSRSYGMQHGYCYYYIRSVLQKKQAFFYRKNKKKLTNKIATVRQSEILHLACRDRHGGRDNRISFSLFLFQYADSNHLKDIH